MIRQKLGSPDTIITNKAVYEKIARLLAILIQGRAVVVNERVKNGNQPLQGELGTLEALTKTLRAQFEELLAGAAKAGELRGKIPVPAFMGFTSDFVQPLSVEEWNARFPTMKFQLEPLNGFEDLGMPAMLIGVWKFALIVSNVLGVLFTFLFVGDFIMKWMDGPKGQQMTLTAEQLKALSDKQTGEGFDIGPLGVVVGLFVLAKLLMR